MRNLFRKTIWYPGNLPHLSWVERKLLQIVYPILDLLMVAVGMFGWVFIVPALSEVWHNDTVDVLCILFAVVAILCLVGLAFPCLRPLELYAKDVLFLMLIGFIATLGAIISGATGADGEAADSRWYFVPFVVVSAVLVGFRIMWITRTPRSKL